MRKGIVALACIAIAACESRRDDDLIITNGVVYTLAWDEPALDGTPAPNAPYTQGTGWHADAEAIAMRGGRITFVGTSADALKRKGKATEVLDAQGATILPGLVDAHTHLANLGASLRRVNLVGAATEEEVVRRVEERARSTPEGEWIVGYGWDEGAWANHYPDRKLLSARVPKHPVWLAGLHTFAGWTNDLALEMTGVTSQTESPSGGEIRKGPDGKPTGLMLNTAVRFFEQKMPRPDSHEMDARVDAALEAMARAGYTSVHDANVDRPALSALQRIYSATRLRLRVMVYLAATDSVLVREWIERGPDTARTSMLSVRGVKGFYDGALGSRGALLLEPYSDRPGERGRGGAEYGFNAALMTKALDRGFQLMIHAIGDAGNRQALDFFAAAVAKNPAVAQGRHRIEHAQILSQGDIPRFAQLGVIASMQPGHAIEDKAWAEQRVGPERIKGGYAWRSLRKSGARLVLSSDMPGSSYDFFYMLRAATTRQDPSNQPPSGWFPDERLTAEEAVRGFTSWAAYAVFDEANTGTIAIGKRADLTFLDTDPFTATGDELLNGKATLVFVAGKRH
jgi:predicted amidohydrolase YtcJ